MVHEKNKQKHIWQTILPGLAWLIRLRGSPKAVSLGVAIGVFISFTPTIGFQIVLAAFFSTIFNASRPAAIACVWITNPLTMLFIYGFTYRMGNFFWGGNSLTKVKQFLLITEYRFDKHSIWEFYDKSKIFLSLGKDILIPLSIGGTIMGVITGSLSYIIVFKIIKRYRNMHYHASH